MIKIKLRRNLLYLLTLHSTVYIRKIVSRIIDIIFKLNAPYILLYMMVLGEISGGLGIYIYHNAHWKKKKEVKYFGIGLIQTRKNKSKTEGNFKKIILIFFASYFDITEFIVDVFYCSKITVFLHHLIQELVAYHLLHQVLFVFML